MSAAVATRAQQQQPSTHTSSGSTPRMGGQTSVDRKKSNVKFEDTVKAESSSQARSNALETTDPVRTDPSTTTVVVSADPSAKETSTSSANVSTTQPLAPPPRPATQNAVDAPDYFSGVHNGSQLSLEPNPFEQSFSNSGAETPGKSLLPPVASLTSPASLLRDGGASAGFNWPNSLRSGPLSPAMLTGPTGPSDYFDGHIRAGFPTPNESSLRTGLTPGGGGSMFPAPSPNSQAILQQLASGGATPATLDFHRTAINAAAVQKADNGLGGAVAVATSQAPGLDLSKPALDLKADASKAAPAVGPTMTDPFGQHDANDAANGLFLLAQARNGSQGSNQFVPTNQTAAMVAGAGLPATTNGNTAQPAMVTQVQQVSAEVGKRAGRNASGSLGSISGSVRGVSEMSAEHSESATSEQAKPNTRNKGKRAGAGKGGGGNRRKAEETPSKAPANKKAKTSVSAMPDFTVDSDEEMDPKQEMLNENGKKMTDEEKRKNFLERNRVAALKCRQRKKQWLANLQHKVEAYSSDNDALSSQVTQLREEIVKLKTILLAHKDCPVSQAQGLGALGMAGMNPEFNPHANPYGMPMAGNPVMAGQGMPRR